MEKQASNNNDSSSNRVRCNSDPGKDEIDFVNAAASNNNSYNYNYNNYNNNNNKNIKTMEQKLLNNYYNNNNLNGSTKNSNRAGALEKQDPSSIHGNEDTTATGRKKSDVESNEKKTVCRGRLSLFSFNKRLSQKNGDSTKFTKSTTPAVATTPRISAQVTNTIATTASLNENGTAAGRSGNTTRISLTPARAVSLENMKTIGCGLEESGFGEKLAMSPAIDSTCNSTVRQHKFVKSSSIARFLGNTYNAKKFEKEEQKRLANNGKFHTFAGRRRHRLNGPYLERFRQCSKEYSDNIGAEATLDLRNVHIGSRHNDSLSLDHPEEEDCHADFSTKAMRTITRGLGKLWWRRSHSVEISTPDPEYKVSYLGNVLTGWAKGEGCVEKQLSTLWRNYTQNTKPDVVMRVKVCASGLKATTRQHGLTEYWANRITHCCAPKNYPRVFCWIYRHEGRKLKHELRCHAVLCSKEKVVQEICSTLKENLESALREFRREKILKQNARLSLANAVYENPSLPRRKILLSVGGNNYRPPLERSKSAPKLMAIEESIGEEEGDDVEETNEPEMRPCCQKDSLYPAMTLGRRRCRRGHSIRRTGKARPTLCAHGGDFTEQLHQAEEAPTCCSNSVHTKENNAERRHSYGSDDSDDFEKLLKCNDYDTSTSLANELLPYFDLQLHKRASNSLGSLHDHSGDDDDDVETGPLTLLPTVNSSPSADTAVDDFDDNDAIKEHDPGMVRLRKSGVCSDGEEEFLDHDDMYFRQASILNMLQRNSMRKMSQLALSSDEGSIETNASVHHQVQSSVSSNASSTLAFVSAAEQSEHPDSEAQRRSASAHATDSDEGSISSGCETASTVTGNQDDMSLRYRQSKLLPPLMQLAAAYLELHAEEEPPATVDEIYQRLKTRLDGRHGSDATTFSTSSSVTLKLGSSPTPSLNGGDTDAPIAATRKSRRQTAMTHHECGDSDSDCSDESGYVEYLVGERSSRPATMAGSSARPQPPPKPLPRRNAGVSRVGTTTVV